MLFQVRDRSARDVHDEGKREREKQQYAQVQQLMSLSADGRHDCIVYRWRARPKTAE